MDLEKLEKEYKGAKKDKLYASLDVMEKRLEILEKDKKDKTRQLEDAEKKKQRAEEDKDKDKVEEAKKEIKDAKETLEKIKKQIEKQKETITKTKGNVEKYIDEIAKDPEIKEQIDKMIAGKAKKKVKEIEDKKQKVTNFQELLKKHPNVEANVVGIINTIDEGLKGIELKTQIEDKLKTEKDPSKIAKLNKMLDDIEQEIDKLEGQYETNKSSILKCAKKSNIEIDEKWLKDFCKLGSYKKAHYKDGRININKTLKNEIKAYDKEIKPYKTTLRNVGMLQTEELRREAQEERDNSQNDQPIMGDHTQDGLDTGSPNPDNLPATTDTPEKPKWSEIFRHPIKFFKDLSAYNKSKYKDLGHIDRETQEEGQQEAPEQSTPEQETPEQPTPEQVEQANAEKETRNKQNREFRKALHYDVVNAYVDKRKEELEKEDFREEAAPQNNENDQQNSDEAR